MNWLLRIAFPSLNRKLNGAWQRAWHNPRTSLAGIGMGGVFEAFVTYLQQQGCSLENVEWLGLLFVLHGAYVTDRDKAMVQADAKHMETVQIGDFPPLMGGEPHPGGRSF